MNQNVQSADGHEKPAERRPLLQVKNLVKHFPIARGVVVKKQVGAVRAVDGVSFDVYPGETVALVGESGCGKSTTGRLVLRLLDPTSGEVLFDGQDVHTLGEKEMRRVRREMQIIFQDPYASLSPRLRVEEIVAEPLQVHRLYSSRAEMRNRIAEILSEVGLSPEYAVRYPFEFSGGQRQRVGIARALAVNPQLIVADEPVSALDVSIQSQVINLLQDLQERYNIAYVFIAHDLAVVRHISNRIGVMYLGVLVEVADKVSLFDAPHHPYTQALLSAVPIPDPTAERNKIVLSGDVPSPRRVPSGCRFHTRCPLAADICRNESPPMKTVGEGHSVACHFAKPFPLS